MFSYLRVYYLHFVNGGVEIRLNRCEKSAPLSVAPSTGVKHYQPSQLIVNTLSSCPERLGAYVTHEM